MISVKNLQSMAWKLIIENGSTGKVIRVIDRPIAGITALNRNSYDEDGNELTVNSVDLEEIEFYYIARQLRGYEKSPNSLNSGLIRVTCVSQDLDPKDYLKNNIKKGDKFLVFDGTEYSIEEVHHVGHMQDVEIVLELICSRV
jgi:hypothetical protein